MHTFKNGCLLFSLFFNQFHPIGNVPAGSNEREINVHWHQSDGNVHSSSRVREREREKDRQLSDSIFPISVSTGADAFGSGDASSQATLSAKQN